METPETERPRARHFNRIRVFYRMYRKRLIATFVVVAHVVGALTSVEAIMQTRTPQGAVAWAVSLNLFPYGAVPAYWAFGHTQFKKYNAVRDLNEEKFDPIRKAIGESTASQNLRVESNHPIGKMLEALANLSFTKDNKVDLLINGRQTYDAMYEAIEGAEKYILFQTYILRDDATGQRFADKLIAKAKQGVKVKVLYDEIGSLGLSNAFIKRLAGNGISIAPFSTNERDGRKYQLNFRNHRKILIVDGHTAFTGGLNIGDEYLGKDPELGFFRDTHMRVIGPAATMLQLPFAEDWYWAAGEVPKDLDWALKPSTEAGEATVLAIPTGPADMRETCGLFFLAAINSAEKRLWIATAYFVPDQQILSALKLAALRGVDVRILVPDENDSTLVEYSSYAYLDDITAPSIRTFRYTKGFMHQKVMLIDDNISCVGSANMDNRSFRLNFEAVLCIKDISFAERMEKMLEEDFSHAKETKPGDLGTKTFSFRLASKVSRLLAPIQ